MHGDSGISPAVRADEMWRPLLRAAALGPVRGTVESAFAHAVNAAFGEAGGAPFWARFALLADRGGRAPGALITQRRDFAGVEAGDAVVIDSDGIRIERDGSSVVIDVVGAGAGAGAGAVGWGRIEFFDSAVEPVAGSGFGGDAEPPCGGAAAGEGRAWLDPDLVSEVLAVVARAGSFVPAPGEPPFSRAVRASLDAARGRFRTALDAVPGTCGAGACLDGAHLDGARPRGADARGELREAVLPLIGLGVGLTPTGDDYLVGALCMLSVHPTPRAAEMRHALAGAVREALLGPTPTDNAPDRTTPVSRHFLLAATERAFQRDLADAGRAVLAGSSRDADLRQHGHAPGAVVGSRTAGDPVTAAFAAAAAAGSTSGTDALHGLVDAYAALAPEQCPLPVQCADPDPAQRDPRPRAELRPRPRAELRPPTPKVEHE